MTRNNTQKLVLAAVFAALCCVATMIIHVPTPGTGGYIHLGDAFVILSGILLGPVYGAAAAGIGSMLADILSGYAQYAIPTLIIKALAALAAALLFKMFKGKKLHLSVSVIPSGLTSAVIVVLGYFLAESTFLGYGIGAAASMPLNFVQGVAGTVIAAILCPILNKIPYLRDLLK